MFFLHSQLFFYMFCLWCNLVLPWQCKYTPSMYSVPPVCDNRLRNICDHFVVLTCLGCFIYSTTLYQFCLVGEKSVDGIIHYTLFSSVQVTFSRWDYVEKDQSSVERRFHFRLLVGRFTYSTLMKFQHHNTQSEHTYGQRWRSILKSWRVLLRTFF